MSETYISFDIEADGPIPGEFSMLSLGAVAYDETGKSLGEFYTPIKPLLGAKQDPKTMQWWSTQPAAWKAVNDNPIEPKEAIELFAKFLSQYKHPVAVAYPAGFDFTFLFWYLTKFLGYSPVSFSCIDIKTYAMAALNQPYKKTKKSEFPIAWDTIQNHTHIALDDAKEQGELFFKIKKAIDGLHSKR